MHWAVFISTASSQHWPGGSQGCPCTTYNPCCPCNTCWRKHRLGSSLLMVLTLIKRHPWTKEQLVGLCPTLQINAENISLSHSERHGEFSLIWVWGFFQTSCQLVISHHGANCLAKFVLILLLGSGLLP